MPVFDSVLSAHDNATLLVALGAVLVALTLLRLLRRVGRMIWTAAVLAAVSGGGWTVLDGLKIWH